MTVQDQLKANQQVQFDQNMAMHTLMGNLQHWRKNQKNNANRMKIITGRAKIFQLLQRFNG
tara:strand:+ start:529 stop:711 length:183 start_codon:yes stop_codon:yes gene_type:complete